MNKTIQKLASQSANQIFQQSVPGRCCHEFIFPYVDVAPFFKQMALMNNKNFVKAVAVLLLLM